MNTQYPSPVRVGKIIPLAKQCKIYRWNIARHTTEPVEVSIACSYDINKVSPGVLVLRLVASYHSVRNLIIRPLLSYGVEIEFEVDSLNEIVDEGDEGLLIPSSLLNLTMSIGVGALRGMIALECRNTSLVHYPLPVMKISDLVAHITPSSNLTLSLSQVADTPGFGEMPSITVAPRNATLHEEAG